MRRDFQQSLVAMLFTACGLLAMGCGDSTNNGGAEPGPQDDFIGMWELESTTNTAFNLTCPNATAGMPPTVQPYLQWGRLQFEHGVLADLFETSGLHEEGNGGCTPPLSFNISGNTATIVNPDPISGVASLCTALAFDQNGDPVALLDFAPRPDFGFTITPGNPVARGALKGTADVTPWVPDEATGMLVAQETCTYMSAQTGDAFRRLSRP